MNALFAAAALLCCVLSILYGLRLREAERINTAILHGGTANSPLPQVQLAHAIGLARTGHYTAAAKAYKSLLDTSDEVRLPALYDLGNLNMREALKSGSGEALRFMPLIELAKQSYRDELRSNPADWDARYNLERALWLAPEYDDPMLERSQTPVRSEHAVSTLQGAKIDLP